MERNNVVHLVSMIALLPITLFMAYLAYLFTEYDGMFLFPAIMFFCFSIWSSINIIAIVFLRKKGVEV